MPARIDSLLDFDGVSYEPAEDEKRLGSQLYKVREVALRNTVRYLTPRDWEVWTGYNWASISARLRDLRKEKFGGYTVERKRLDGGTWGYKVIDNA